MKGIIKIAPKNISEFNGHKTISFQIEGEATWYKVEGDEQTLNDAIELMRKGAEVEYTIDKYNTTRDLLVTKPAPEQAKSGDWKDEMTSFEDLLEAGHKKGIKSLKTTLIEHNYDKKFAVFKAEVIMKGGSIFEATGDANQENVGNMIKPHYIRMAETRAIARCLRFSTNNAQTCDIETDSSSGMAEEGFL